MDSKYQHPFRGASFAIILTSLLAFGSTGVSFANEDCQQIYLQDFENASNTQVVGSCMNYCEALKCDSAVPEGSEAECVAESNKFFDLTGQDVQCPVAG